MSMTQPNGRGDVYSITIVILNQLLVNTAEADFVSPRVYTGQRLSHGIALYSRGNPKRHSPSGLSVFPFADAGMSTVRPEEYSTQKMTR